MGITSLRFRTAVATILALSALGCGPGTDTTGPTEEHPAIPYLTESNSNCAVWSCSSGQCAQDPAIYGACCTTITDPGEPGVPKPANCNAPPGGGGSFPAYCSGSNPYNSCVQRASTVPGWYIEDCTAMPDFGEVDYYLPECG